MAVFQLAFVAKPLGKREDQGYERFVLHGWLLRAIELDMMSRRQGRLCRAACLKDFVFVCLCCIVLPGWCRYTRGLVGDVGNTGHREVLRSATRRSLHILRAGECRFVGWRVHTT